LNYLKVTFDNLNLGLQSQGIDIDMRFYNLDLEDGKKLSKKSVKLDSRFSMLELE
tara:strand:- start:31267 stop:31431 length:165 start_codon:yes stop_codon:yes gene_type:complete